MASSPQGIVVLGSTGSIGRSTLDVLSRHPGRFRVVALSANRNVERLADQCTRHKAEYAVVCDPGREAELRQALKSRGSDARVLAGPEGLEEVVGLTEADTVMAAIVGAAGLPSALSAARQGKRLLLANKESMVIAGPLFAAAARERGAVIIPVDSEHNALFQALPPGFDHDPEAQGVEALILTASGGPFRHLDLAALRQVTPKQACAHPNWDMGRKISVDSATLMNKGLEVIEARWLFHVRPEQIRVVIHPQSIIHSMVSYRDGSVLAQLGMPDMRTPIAHALGWPERIESGVARLDLTRMGSLEFAEPDMERFPCLRLAFQALETGGSAPVILNAANKIAVEAFLEQRIGFMDIPRVIEGTMADAESGDIDRLETVLAFDRRARSLARQMVRRHG